MSDKPTAQDIVSSPAWDRSVSRVAKGYIFAFFFFCAVVAFTEGPQLPWWQWAAVIVGGMFVVAIAFALPVTGLKLLIATRTSIDPHSAAGMLLYLFVDFLGYAALWLVTREVLLRLGT